jgi:hypothetical protein
MPLLPSGFRGALLFDAGLYPIYGTVYKHSSGVVLKGSGEGTNPDHSTILQGKFDPPTNEQLLSFAAKNSLTGETR